MWCPECASPTKVIGTEQGLVTERFRKCKKCSYTFTTVEAVKYDDYWKEYAKSVCEIENIGKDRKEKEDL